MTGITLALARLSPLLAAGGDGPFDEHFIENLVQALVFSLLGMVMFALFWFICVRVTPFSVRKEIEHDQNTALAVVIGAMIIGIALIVSAAILG